MGLIYGADYYVFVSTETIFPRIFLFYSRSKTWESSFVKYIKTIISILDFLNIYFHEKIEKSLWRKNRVQSGLGRNFRSYKAKFSQETKLLVFVIACSLSNKTINRDENSVCFGVTCFASEMAVSFRSSRSSRSVQGISDYHPGNSFENWENFGSAYLPFIFFIRVMIMIIFFFPFKCWSFFPM